MSKTPVANVVPTVSEDELYDRKRAIAYQMWEEEGRPEGKAEEHWERACLIVMSLSENVMPTEPDWLRRSETVVAAKPVTEAAPLSTIGKRVAA